jgi:hypothetical protein
MNSPISKRHHFIPEFYLKSWATESGQLFVYQRNKNGEVNLRKGSAKSIAFEFDLYTLKSVADWLSVASDKIESQILSKIDNSAKVIHEKIVREGISSLTHNDKIAFSLFINSLIERNPKQLKKYRNAINDINMGKNRKLLDNLEKSGIDLEILKDNESLGFMARRLLDSSFAEHFTNMEWITISLKSLDKDSFVIGDSPLFINNDNWNDEPIILLAIALTPKILLILHQKSPQFDEEFTKIIASMYSISTIMRSQKYLISNTTLTDSPHIKYSKAMHNLFSKKNLTGQ